MARRLLIPCWLTLLLVVPNVRADLVVANTDPVYPQKLRPDPWSVGALYIGHSPEDGYNASGYIQIKDGSRVNATTTYLGYGPLGAGDISARDANPVTDEPSTFLSENLAVGWTGVGFVTVRDGGSLMTDYAVIGNYGRNDVSGLPGRGTILIEGSDAKWIGTLNHIGAEGTGTVTVAGGANVQAVDTFLGLWEPPGGDAGAGTVLVRTGASWTCTGLFSVGFQGVGKLFVQGQGVIESRTGRITQNFSRNTHSVATIENAGSIWRIQETFDIGGQLLIRSGGRVETGGEARVNWVGLRPVAIVEDAGSTWANAAALIIGGDGDGSLFGTGQMRVQAGGVVTSLHGHVQNGDVYVSGAGSRWTVANALHVGRNGTLGTLDVVHGGLVEADRAFVGAANGSGHVRVLDADSRFRVTQDLQIGGESPGTENSLTAMVGGRVEVGNDLTVARLGQLNVQPGGVISTRRLFLSVPTSGNGGEAAVNGAGSLIRVEQLLRAAHADNLVFGGGAVDLLRGAAIFDYASAPESPLETVRQQIINGHAGGAWTGHGMTSSEADASRFALGYAEASAVFSSFPELFHGQSVDGTTVLVAFTRYGDANLDGAVNLSDFNRLAGNFGLTGTDWSMGDFNYDGVVNLVDFNRLGANFGLMASGSIVTPRDWATLAAAVPEPGTACWVVSAAASLLSQWRRRRTRGS